MKTNTEIAMIMTTRAANLKDWRITNKRTRAAREAARELLAQGGYFIGTKAEAAAKWPGIVKLTAYESEPDAVFMWAFDVPVLFQGERRRDIDLVPIARIAEGCKYYNDRDEAYSAAVAYQIEHGGTICDGRGEDTDDGHIIGGGYEFVAVAQGATEENPLGDSWEEFPYNYTKI